MKKIHVIFWIALFLLSFLIVKPSLLMAAEHGGTTMMEGSHMEEKGDVAIKGYCPVCVINMGVKVKGSDHFVTEYKGKVYKFVSIDQQKMFLADPEKYVKDLDAKFMAIKDDGMMKKDGKMMMDESHMEEGSH